VKGKEVVELECVFIVYVKKRMLSLDETWVTSNANVQVGKRIIKIKK
jgi:hypothetical protein